MKRFLIVMAAVLLTALSVSAKVSLPSLVGDNMVLQRNTSVNVWGKAKAGAKVSVSVSWSKERYRTKADPDGNWRVMVATADAGGPHTMTISDGEPVTVRGIMLGEVWLCCGQSNMEMPLCGFMMQPVENYPEYLMDVPTEASLIRFFQVPRVPADEPADTCGGEWLLPTMRNASQFSACGYFFGRALSKALVGVPVGLISSNWGGTRIECWMSDEAILSTEGINHEFALSGEGVTSEPHRLFNSMIWPLRHYTAKGWIWYQGESNRINWFDYRNLMVSMVDLWRNIWEDEGMPFYFVQLAPYPYNGEGLRSLPLVVEAQYQAMAQIPHSGIAATTDIGSRTCIHPRKKMEVGTRLAWLALRNDYGVDGVPLPAPTYKSMEKEYNDYHKCNQLVLSFNNLSGQNEFNESDSILGFASDGYYTPGGFEIAGADKVWHKAKVNFRWWQNKIEVWSEDVPEPVAARYAFRNYPEDANVMTTSGQPFAPFRTDDWEVKDVGIIK
jgi:sialate O-acetylesterase